MPRKPLRQACAIETVERRLLLTTYVVTNTADSGPGSLRDAINVANGHAGADIIDFDIPGTGVHSIQPATGLPDITDPVVINGYSQPGAAPNTLALGDNAVLEIEINGGTAGFGNLGFSPSGSGSELRGIVLNHGPGLFLQSGCHNITIDGNFFGTDPTGMTASDITAPVLVQGNTLLMIGGNTPGARNIIANGSRYGISLSGGNSNTVRNNLIGVAADGHTPLGNRVGLSLSLENHDTIGGNVPGTGNVISASRPAFAGQPAAQSVGLQLTNSPQNLIQGNLIGTDATGTMAVPNQGAGISIDAASRATDLIGNTVSGNGGDGIDFLAVPGAVPGSTSETVSNNFIGTDSNGAQAIGNGGSGITLVGSANVLNDNVISGNGVHGIDIRSEGEDVIRGNAIGTDASGKSNLGNHGDGVLIETAAGNTIGGTGSGMPNTIAFNGGNGITVGVSPATTQAVNNRISGNSIFANAHLGIDLGDNGVTVNTPGGPHSGPNTLQNFPVISFVRTDPSGTHVTGTLSSTPGRIFSLEFFANRSPDPSGYGQGATYLGSIQVSTDNSGNARFTDAALPTAAPVLWVITATATDVTGNTSEFSAGSRAHLTGDLNDDKSVDFTDLLALAQHYGQAGTFPQGDINADGQVNFADLLLLAQNYGRTAAASASASPTASNTDPVFLSAAKRRTRVP